ncbi:MAG TPA: hypothetical protein VLG40_02970 [Candidatus Saccharimonas sp.]|nr:hypothetical protein [Candidatus Saccharimonas sp.]
MVALIGGIGYYVYSQNQNKQQNTASTSQNSQTKSSDTSSSSNSSAQTQPSVSYLTIKEWGVKVAQPTGNTISYQISKYDANTAQFVTSEQKTLGGACGTFPMARYTITRMTTGTKSSDTVLQNKLDAAAQSNQTVQIGNMTYYIVKDMSGGDCVGNGQINPQEAVYNNNLLAALKGLVAAN